MRKKLLGVSTDAKTVKGEKRGFLTGILYLAPHTLGGPNVCPNSTAACRADCLFSAGRGAMQSVADARIAKTRAYWNDRAGFVSDLCADIEALRAKAIKQGMTPAVRLNGTSDITWETHGIMQRFPDVTFYDYTKRPVDKRAKRCPANYRLTFSFDGEHPLRAANALALGHGVACVVDATTKAAMLASGHVQGLPVVDGDADDLRFLDPPSAVVLLTPKGTLRQREAGGFIVTRSHVEHVAASARLHMPGAANAPA